MSSTTVSPVKAKYYFSVDCPLQTAYVGELADGLRFHIDYEDAGEHAVSTNDSVYRTTWLPAGSNPAASELDELRKKQAQARPSDGFAKDLTWLGLTGKILSGADLATVRSDGVATLDARITIQAIDGFKLQGIFAGLVDLGKDGQSRVTNGGLAKADWPVRMVARFEASQAVPDIAAPRYKHQSLGAWKYEELTRRQFVATGTVTLAKDKEHCPATNIQFDVYALDL